MVFTNLKALQDDNIFNVYEHSLLWHPTVVFYNTEDKENTVLDERAQLKVRTNMLSPNLFY